MANRKTQHALDNIFPDRKDSHDSFLKAINSPASYKPVNSSAPSDAEDKGNKIKCNCYKPKQ